MSAFQNANKKKIKEEAAEVAMFGLMMDREASAIMVNTLVG